MRARKPVAWIAIIVGAALLGLLAFEKWPDNRRLVPLAGDTGRSIVTAPGYRKVGYVPRLFTAYATERGHLYGIEDHYLYRSEDGGRTFEQLGVLPETQRTALKLIEEKFARSKVVRLIRKNEGPRDVVVLPSGTVLVIGAGAVYRSTDGGRTFDAVYDTHDLGIAPPMPVGATLTADGRVYFGEYIADRQKHPIRIVEGRNDGREWRVAHTFAPGEIDHVHSVQYDAYRHRVWVCTGDIGDRAQVLFTDDGFRTLNRLGGSTQDWRAVSLLIAPDYLYWGSDDISADGAGIFRWDFSRSELRRMQFLGKPAYYSTILRDGTMLISTAYEAKSNYVKSKSPDPTAEIWASRDGVHWTKVMTVGTNLANPTNPVAPRSSIAFPLGARLNEIVYSLMGTEAFDYTTQILDIEPPAQMPSTSRIE